MLWLLPAGLVTDAGLALAQITAEGIRGRFRQALTNTNFVDADGSLSLGVLTFNQFGPKDLKVLVLCGLSFAGRSCHGVHEDECM